jgi:membrane protease subunit HflK
VAVDRERRVEVGYRETEEAAPPGQLLTGDHNLVNVRVVLLYQVRPDAVEDYVAQADRVEPLLARAAEAVMADWAAGRDVDEVLLNGKTSLKEALVRQTPERLEPYRLGVMVTGAEVGLLTPPDAVKSAFDEVSRAQSAIATAVNRAQQEADSAYRAAQALSERLEQESLADAGRLVRQAQADADVFLGRLRAYRELRAGNPHYLRQLWEKERNDIFAEIQKGGQIEPLDHYLGRDGWLDLSVAPLLPRRR